MFRAIISDFGANKRNPKGALIALLYRVANACLRIPLPLRYISYPYLIFYRLVVEWLLGVEIPWKVKIGKGLVVYHGVALVINDRAIIGDRCVLRHSTTIGVGRTDTIEFTGDAPIIGNDVDIGANVVILGGVRVGDNARIGAGSVVVHDVPHGAVVVGNPARPLRSGT